MRIGSGAGMTAPARFNQADVTRFVKGVVAAGVRVGRVEITINGTIVALAESVAPAGKSNAWDQEFEG